MCEDDEDEETESEPTNKTGINHPTLPLLPSPALLSHLSPLPSPLSFSFSNNDFLIENLVETEINSAETGASEPKEEEGGKASMYGFPFAFFN